MLEWLAYPPGDLPDPGIEPESPALRVDYLPTELSGKPIIFEISYYPLRQAVHLNLNTCLMINERICVGEGKSDFRKLVLTVKGKGKL